MICRNLQLRPLAWTTTLLYFMSVEAPQQALGTHREVPHSSQCYSTWAPELGWVKQAKEEVTEQGPPPPHCSLNHTHSSPTMPQHRAPWELLPSPTCEPLLASPAQGVSCASGPYGDLGMHFQHKDSPTATDQKPLRKVSNVFLGNGTRMSMGDDLLNPSAAETA